MTVALLLLSLGLTDLLRAGVPPRHARWAVPLTAALLALGALLGLGAAPAAVAGVLLATLAWILAMPQTERRGRAQLGPVVTLAAITAALALFDPSRVAGPVAASYPAHALIDPDRLLLLLALIVFLTRSANLITRTALRRGEEREDETVPEPPVRRTHRALPLRRRSDAAPLPTQHDNTAVHLRGGRIIGPLERLLIVALALAGLPALIAGLLAAKGVVRFPEISRDRSGGGAAEEFLIGSLVSWSLAAGAAALLALLPA